jgi:hypothetical protein
MKWSPLREATIESVASAGPMMKNATVVAK